MAALEQDEMRWEEWQREKETDGKGGCSKHRHDSGIVAQQTHQHSLTASPNNQLRAGDGSQQKWEKSPGAPGKASGTNGAAVNSYSGFPVVSSAYLFSQAQALKSV